MTVVVDASAVLAMTFGERGGDAVALRLQEEGGLIGAVNYAEVSARLVDAGYSDADVVGTMRDLRALVTAFDRDLAVETGLMRRATRDRGLSLGDRACLALARREGLSILTADRAWAALDVGVEVELIR